MDEKRMGEIALAIVKNDLSRKGIRLNPDLMRDVGNTAQATNIPRDDLRQFYKIIYKELFEKAFGEYDLEIS